VVCQTGFFRGPSHNTPGDGEEIVVRKEVELTLVSDRGGEGTLFCGVERLRCQVISCSGCVFFCVLSKDKRLPVLAGCYVSETSEKGQECPRFSSKAADLAANWFLPNLSVF